MPPFRGQASAAMPPHGDATMTTTIRLLAVS
jgi:hypothetical protein